MMNRTPIQNLLMLKLFSGQPTPVPTEEATATGNPATFTTDVKKPLTSLTIPFTPVQSGSGDPSHENVRPIAGITGITVSHSGEDTSAPTTYAVTFPGGTVYGGELNAITGVLTVSWKTVDLSAVSWALRSENQNRQIWEFAATDRKAVGGSELPHAMCSEFSPTTQSGSWTVGKFAPATEGGSNVFIFIVPPGSYTTSAEVQQGMQGVEFVYELETPTTINLSDTVAPVTLIGENNIWTDTNGTNTVKYLKKVTG